MRGIGEEGRGDSNETVPGTARSEEGGGSRDSEIELRATSRATGDMPPETFRGHAHEAVEWMAAYLDGVEEYPVFPAVRPGDLRSALPSHPPEQGESFEAIFRDFREQVVPGITHWNHPGFMGYFAVTGSGPGILGEMLSAALNINAMVWRSSPAGTELEEHSVDWLRQLLGLPDAFKGVINDTASHSSLYALAAAREAAFPEIRTHGFVGLPQMRVYASSESHSSIEKAAITLGFGQAGLCKIPADECFRMRPDLLRKAIEEDVARGVRPVAIVATVGTTSSSSVDPVAEIVEIANEFGLWLHVDAAYAGSAAIVSELRPHFAGWEDADTVLLNPHKWLFTPVDCSVLYCRRPETLKRAFSIVPEYLQTRETDETTSLMDYGVALGRRFRSLKLWFVLRYFGGQGIADRIREHCRLACMFRDSVEASPDWEVVAPVPFSTVAFRFSPEDLSGVDADAVNLDILERVNASGEAFLSHTRLAGRVCIRMSIGNLRTEERHVEAVWRVLSEAGRDALREMRPTSIGAV